MIFAQATREDYETFAGKAPEFSFKGFVAKDDSGVHGVAGVYRENGHLVGFSGIGEKVRKDKKMIAKAARMFRKMCDALGEPVYAVQNANEPTAQGFLKHLGFEPTGYIGPAGEVMRRDAL